ncbi:MAG: hypothetical protein GF393_02560, partial [Armatimonadia bacterium]|nr:hypothetical protein [Armatimonadia bacterium]
MRLRRVVKFIACAVPAAAAAIMLPWWVYDPLVRLGVPEDPLVYQACIVLSATVLMVGIAVAWHVAGWPLVGQSDDVPAFLRENRYPAAVIILALVAGAWGIAGVTAAADVVDAIADWGFVGQVVTGLFAAFVMSLIGLGL